jgi:oligosaccharide repeat unit polymerase
MVHDYLSIGVLIISIFSILLSFLMLKKASGVIKIPFISTFFWFKYIVFAYIGSVLLNVWYFDYEVTIGVYERKDLLLNMWYYTTAGLFLIPLGMFIANSATHYKPRHYTSKLLLKDILISKHDNSNIMFFILIILFILSTSVLLVYISKISSVPIFGVFDGLSASKLAYLRSESGNNFTGKLYRYNMFMRDLPLLLLFIAFFMKNISFKWKMLFYSLLSYNVFVSVMDVAKAPVVQLFLLLMLAYFYSLNKISRKVFVVTGVILTSLIMLMYVFVMGMTDKSFFEVLSAPLHRTFIGQISPFYWWQFFQEQNGYVYGTSFPNPAHIFPFEWRRITVEVMNFAHPELVKLGIVGSMPTVFFADWFINFGSLMALFSMILLGFILQSVDIVFITKLSLNKSVLISVLFVYMINYFGQFAGTSFTGIVFDTQLLFPCLILFLIIILRQFIYKILRSISVKSCINSIK